MPTRPDDDRLLDLLERWETSQRAGHGADFEALCAACPEMAGELRRRIAALEHLESLMTDTSPTGAARADGNGDGDPLAGPVLMPAMVPFGDLRFHASGGQSDVFQGYDESLGRPVAVKLLGRLRAGFPESRRRFENEAEITGRLEHPGIAPVYCRGEAADGRPYYAMQFIRGETLQDAIDRFHAADRPGRDPGERGLALRQLLTRFQDVCNTVAYAHSRSVLHRDLKPRNIMLGEFGETIVVDWGLGKRLDQESARPAADRGRNGQAGDPIGRQVHTLPDEATGSPGYMSPEQAAGDLGRIGPATDVYSLGAILYGLLAGCPAISGPDLAAILLRTKTGDFPRPGQVNRLVPSALEAVCLKAMALEPAERYLSPTELAEEIGRWMADEPVRAWQEPLSIRARRWMRRRRTAVSAAVATALVARIGTIAVLTVQARGARDLKRAYDALAAANRDLVAANRREAARFDLAMEAVNLFHGEVSEDLQLQEDQFDSLRAKLLRGAASFYSKLEGLLEGPDPRSRAALGLVYHRMGQLLSDLRKPPESLESYERAMAIQQELVDANPGVAEFRSELASTLSEYAVRLWDSGRPDESMVFHRRAREIQRELVDGHPQTTEFRRALALSESSIGALLRYTGHPTEALESFERALAILLPLAESNPSSAALQNTLAHTLMRIGAVLVETGRPAEARRPVEKAVAIAHSLADANPTVNGFHDTWAVLLAKLGRIHQTERRVAEAVVAYRKAAAILEPRPGLIPGFQYNVACFHALLAGVAAQPGSGMTAAEGRAEAERAMTWLQKAFSGGYGNVSWIRIDPDLDPLRSRPDFQLLMMELAFPDDPSLVESRARSARQRAPGKFQNPGSSQPSRRRGPTGPGGGEAFIPGARSVGAAPRWRPARPVRRLPGTGDGSGRAGCYGRSSEKKPRPILSWSNRVS
jgi:serine/threonine-protein kinase